MHATGARFTKDFPTKAPTGNPPTYIFSPNISTWLPIAPYARRCVSIDSSPHISSSILLQLGHTCDGVQHLCNQTSSTLNYSTSLPKIPPYCAKTRPLGSDWRKSEGGVFGRTLPSMLSAHFAHPAARAIVAMETT